MSKNILTVSTPVGDFTRATDSKYTHIVVRQSERAMRLYTAVKNGDENAIRASKLGVDARWVKDHGFAVTWHASEVSAQRAARGHYGYDWNAPVIGIFEVA